MRKTIKNALKSAGKVGLVVGGIAIAGALATDCRKDEDTGIRLSASNLRQLYAALASYSCNYGGELPPNNNGPSYIIERDGKPTGLGLLCKESGDDLKDLLKDPDDKTLDMSRFGKTELGEKVRCSYNYMPRKLYEKPVEALLIGRYAYGKGIEVLDDHGKVRYLSGISRKQLYGMTPIEQFRRVDALIREQEKKQREKNRKSIDARAKHR